MHRGSKAGTRCAGAGHAAARAGGAVSVAGPRQDGGQGGDRRPLGRPSEVGAQGTAKVPLEDINWAREILNDVERRIRADAASLNADTQRRRARRSSPSATACRTVAGRLAAAGQREGAGRLSTAGRSARRQRGTGRCALPFPRCPKNCRPCRSARSLVQQPLDPWASNYDHG